MNNSNEELPPRVPLYQYPLEPFQRITEDEADIDDGFLIGEFDRINQDAALQTQGFSRIGQDAALQTSGLEIVSEKVAEVLIANAYAQETIVRDRFSLTSPITLIGDRSPITGQYEVISSSGGDPKFGDKIFNAKSKPGDLVRSISDGVRTSLDGNNAPPADDEELAIRKELDELTRFNRCGGYLRNGQIFNCPEGTATTWAIAYIVREKTQFPSISGSPYLTTKFSIFYEDETLEEPLLIKDFEFTVTVNSPSDIDYKKWNLAFGNLFLHIVDKSTVLIEFLTAYTDTGLSATETEIAAGFNSIKESAIDYNYRWVIQGGAIASVQELTHKCYNRITSSGGEYIYYYSPYDLPDRTDEYAGYWVNTWASFRRSDLTFVEGNLFGEIELDATLGVSEQIYPKSRFYSRFINEDEALVQTLVPSFETPEFYRNGIILDDPLNAEYEVLEGDFYGRVANSVSENINPKNPASAFVSGILDQTIIDAYNGTVDPDNKAFIPDGLPMPIFFPSVYVRRSPSWEDSGIKAGLLGDEISSGVSRILEYNTTPATEIFFIDPLTIAVYSIDLSLSKSYWDKLFTDEESSFIADATLSQSGTVTVNLNFQQDPWLRTLTGDPGSKQQDYIEVAFKVLTYDL
jgi:hypothetical protein